MTGGVENPGPRFALFAKFLLLILTEVSAFPAPSEEGVQQPESDFMFALLKI